MQNPLPANMASWRPADEAAAASTMAAFIEWRRATAAHAQGGPATFDEAICRFAGLQPNLGYTETLARAMGRRAALVWIGADARQPIDAAALRAGRIPVAIAAMLATGDGAALARQAADHLLRLEVRPDQRVLWPGPLDQSWPLGALLAGATLLLCETPPPDAEGLAAAEGAVLLRRPV